MTNVLLFSFTHLFWHLCQHLFNSGVLPPLPHCLCQWEIYNKAYNYCIVVDDLMKIWHLNQFRLRTTWQVWSQLHISSFYTLIRSLYFITASYALTYHISPSPLSFFTISPCATFPLSHSTFRGNHCGLSADEVKIHPIQMAVKLGWKWACVLNEGK